jgi:tetratricopeptide (TPR) repeat protein
MPALCEEAVAIAGELDDPAAMAHAFASRRRALWAPERLQERLEASTQMLTCARNAESLELELQAHAWLAVDLLEAGDREAVDAQMESFMAGAARLRQPVFVWHATIWAAMRALLGGELERAEELASDALAAGVPAEPGTAREFYAGQIFVIRREQGRVRELEVGIRQLIERNATRPVWRAALATVLWEVGAVSEARAHIEALARDSFSGIPRNGDWLTAMALIADVSLGTGDAGTAGGVYEQLLPYADANVVVGLGAVCLGSVATYLGKLAAALGRELQAAEHFERALAAHTALRAPLHLARTQLEYARALQDPSRRRELIESVQRTAASLGLEKLAREAAQLRSLSVS